MNAGLALLASASITLACLIAEQGLTRNAAVRRIVATPRGFARLLVGAVLLTAVLASTSLLLLPGLNPVIACIAASGITLVVGAILLQRRYSGDLPDAIVWLVAPAILSILPLAGSGADSQRILIGAFALALVLLLGLPAFVLLMRRLDDNDVHALMRPLPVRILASGVIVLAATGSLSW